MSPVKTEAALRYSASAFSRSPAASAASALRQAISAAPSKSPDWVYSDSSASISDPLEGSRFNACR
ncbi:MAG: hypothetical protein BWZ10_03298 [candidate division BRC1 bacterium ADurb.BinA364]|nr:MAG: hypothetical protein BWZ10_03298 [candidate division BRC1 bacterium ADurb.BinA364]